MQNDKPKRMFFWEIFIVLALVIFAISCRSPLEKEQSAAKKVEQTKVKIADNGTQTVNMARDYTYGADFSLSLDPNPTKYSTVAKSMTTRSLATTGNPPVKETLALQEIVKGLVSTNELLQAEAEKKLAAKDKLVIDLQIKNDKLEAQLKGNEENFKKISENNAILASHWARLTTIFWWIVWGVVILFVLHVLSLVLPPPYNSAFSLVSMIFGAIGHAIFKLVPQATQFAGVVSKDIYHRSEETLKKVVDSVQDFKETHKDEFSKLETILKDKTDKTARIKIQAIKNDLGHI